MNKHPSLIVTTPLEKAYIMKSGVCFDEKSVSALFLHFCLLNVYLADHIRKYMKNPGFKSVVVTDQNNMIETIEKFGELFGADFSKAFIPIQNLLNKRALIVAKGGDGEGVRKGTNQVDGLLQNMRLFVKYIFMGVYHQNEDCIKDETFPYRLTNGFMDMINQITKYSEAFINKTPDKNGNVLSEIDVYEGIRDTCVCFARYVAGESFEGLVDTEPCPWTCVTGMVPKTNTKDSLVMPLSGDVCESEWVAQLGTPTLKNLTGSTGNATTATPDSFGNNEASAAVPSSSSQLRVASGPNEEDMSSFTSPSNTGPSPDRIESAFSRVMDNGPVKLTGACFSPRFPFSDGRGPERKTCALAPKRAHVVDETKETCDESYAVIMVEVIDEAGKSRCVCGPTVALLAWKPCQYRGKVEADAAMSLMKGMTKFCDYVAGLETVCIDVAYMDRPSSKESFTFRIEEWEVCPESGQKIYGFCTRDVEVTLVRERGRLKIKSFVLRRTPVADPVAIRDCGDAMKKHTICDDLVIFSKIDPIEKLGFVNQIERSSTEKTVKSNSGMFKVIPGKHVIFVQKSQNGTSMHLCAVIPKCCKGAKTERVFMCPGKGNSVNSGTMSVSMIVKGSKDGMVCTQIDTKSHRVSK